jgi:acyl-CoA dehydrogenase
METLVRYGTPEQKKQWLQPSSRAHRSAFAMTDPAVASSDATNIERASSARRRLRDQWPQMVDHGRSGSRAADPHLHGQSSPGNANKHQRQSMILVPMDARA